MAADRVAIEVVGDDVDGVALQIPRADTLPDGTCLVALAGKARGGLGRLLPPRGAPPLAVIGSALLARGYVGIRVASEESGRAAVCGESGVPATGPSAAP